ncbi:MAG: PilZ domain-containing protein [bacterium]|nr:PilZ domain-containing protein [bacterium]
MLLDTLKALINASQDALQATCGLPVRVASVSLLARGSLTFPALADISVNGTGLHRVHLGCDSMFCGHLGELDCAAGDESGLETLTSSFVERLVEDLPGRYPRADVESLAVEPHNIRTRGVRTCGFRFETAAGQFFLMAELPSRVEWERERGREFLQVMTESYLPDGWAGRDVFSETTAIESFLVFLRKTELDMECQVPGTDQAPYSTFLVEQCRFGDRRALKLAMAGSDDARSGLLPGTYVAARIGLEERSLEFRLRYIGRSSHELGGDVELPCALFEPPELVTVAQRRQSFRIPLEKQIVADLVLPGRPRRADGGDGPAPVSGLVADLSFSGARITVDSSQPETCFSDGDRVRCLLHLPGHPRPVEILAVVRRTVTTLAEGTWPREELGLEFTISPGRDGDAPEAIRDFVLCEQRSWLSRRIQVAGVDDW